MTDYRCCTWRFPGNNQIDSTIMQQTADYLNNNNIKKFLKNPINYNLVLSLLGSISWKTNKINTP